MRDISFKNTSFRTSAGYGLVFCSQETIDLYRKDALPKGAPEGTVEAAGMLGAKSTGHLIPHCHLVRLDGFNIAMEIIDRESHREILPGNILSMTGFIIRGEAKSIDRSGVEMELLTGLSIACVTLYDLLNPIDNNLEIGSIKLLEKTGGKSDTLRYKPQDTAILVCSGAIQQGKKPDTTGQWIKQQLEGYGSRILDYNITSGDYAAVKQGVQSLVEQEIPIILTVGGTGVGPADQVVQVIQELIEEPVPSIPDAIWHYGGERTSRSLFSRLTAGFAGKSLLITLPGSFDGAQSAINSIFPAVFHFPRMLKKKPG